MHHGALAAIADPVVHRRRRSSSSCSRPEARGESGAGSSSSGTVSPRRLPTGPWMMALASVCRWSNLREQTLSHCGLQVRFCTHACLLVYWSQTSQVQLVREVFATLWVESGASAFKAVNVFTLADLSLLVVRWWEFSHPCAALSSTWTGDIDHAQQQTSDSMTLDHAWFLTFV